MHHLHIKIYELSIRDCVFKFFEILVSANYWSSYVVDPEMCVSTRYIYSVVVWWCWETVYQNTMIVLHFFMRAPSNKYWRSCICWWWWWWNLCNKCRGCPWMVWWDKHWHPRNRHWCPCELSWIKNQIIANMDCLVDVHQASPGTLEKWLIVFHVLMLLKALYQKNFDGCARVHLAPFGPSKKKCMCCIDLFLKLKMSISR